MHIMCNVCVQCIHHVNEYTRLPPWTEPDAPFGTPAAARRRISVKAGGGARRACPACARALHLRVGKLNCGPGKPRPGLGKALRRRANSFPKRAQRSTIPRVDETMPMRCALYAIEHVM